VEETLNALLDAEADQLCKARRYERTAAREDTRAGSYKRSLETKAGKVTMYLAGVSVRRAVGQPRESGDRQQSKQEGPLDQQRAVLRMTVDGQALERKVAVVVIRLEKDADFAGRRGQEPDSRARGDRLRNP